MTGERGSSDRDLSIELLRALAAIAVAGVHLTFGFARYVDGRLPHLTIGDTIAQAAVAAFFVISGAVMILSAGPCARRPVGARAFLARRAIRVLPSYWIATGIFAAACLWLGLPVEAGEFIRSLAFFPPSGAADLPFVPFLWPAWTLAFELVFYAVFGLCLMAGRQHVAGLCAAVLCALVAAGWLLSPEHYAARLATAPHHLLFVAGLGMGTLLARGWRAGAGLRIAAGLAALSAIVVIPQGSGWLLSAGIPGTLAFIAVAGGPIPRACQRTAVIAGGASYAIYLLHIPFAHVWMRVFQQWIGEPGGSLGYLALGLPLLALLSFGFHRGVERPVIRALNRLTGRAGRP